MSSNRSKTYLLPLLSELVDFDKKYHKCIINTFINFEEEKYTNCIGVLHEFSFRNPEFTKYEHRLINNELFYELKDYGSNVLYIFKFPDEYIREYNYYKAGKFSQFGKDCKELILEYFSDVYKGNMNAVPFLLKVKQILFKDSKRRKELEKQLAVKISESAELADIPNKENETFYAKKYTETEKDK